MSLFDTMLGYFTEDAWPFERVEGQPALVALFAGEAAQCSWNLYATVIEAQERVLVYSILPFKVRQADLPRAMELLCRLNYGMVLGNFEIDLADGELRYKTSLCVQGDRLSKALWMHLVAANVLTVDRYLTTIREVVHLGRDIGEALAQAERAD